MALISKAELQQLIIDGDAYVSNIIRDQPGVAIDLLEDLLVLTGHRLKTGFQSIADRKPDRYVFDPNKVPGGR